MRYENCFFLTNHFHCKHKVIAAVSTVLVCALILLFSVWTFYLFILNIDLSLSAQFLLPFI